LANNFDVVRILLVFSVPKNDLGFWFGCFLLDCHSKSRAEFMMIVSLEFVHWSATYEPRQFDIVLRWKSRI